MFPVETYFSLGTNLGDREENIFRALEMMDSAFGTRRTALSALLETEPWGFESANTFLNCAVRYDLGNSPQEILALCKDIEMKMGRDVLPAEYDENGRRVYHSRIIDIDILLYGSARVERPELVIPHPLMSERDFVMVPLSEIISDKAKRAFPEIFQGNCK